MLAVSYSEPHERLQRLCVLHLILGLHQQLERAGVVILRVLARHVARRKTQRAGDIGSPHRGGRHRVPTPEGALLPITALVRAPTVRWRQIDGRGRDAGRVHTRVTRALCLVLALENDAAAQLADRYLAAAFGLSLAQDGVSKVLGQDVRDSRLLRRRAVHLERDDERERRRDKGTLGDRRGDGSQPDSRHERVPMPHVWLSVCAVPQVDLNAAASRK